MVRLKNMSIGKQMVFLVVASGMIATGLGLLVIYHQMQANVWLMMEEQGKIVQAQTEVTRGYIAKNYVGKIKNSSVGSQITVATDHLDTPDAIPYPATSTREISAQLAATGIFSARLFSDRPINRDNLPDDAFEREALTAIMAGAESFARVERSFNPASARLSSASISARALVSDSSSTSSINSETSSKACPSAIAGSVTALLADNSFISFRAPSESSQKPSLAIAFSISLILAFLFSTSKTVSQFYK